MRRLLVALDGSEASDEALAFALSLAAAAGMELHVIVIRSLRLGDQPTALLDLESARAATRIADAAVERAAEQGVHAVAHVGRGDAGLEITEAAVRLGVAMVVVGARGLDGRDALLGSVSTAVAMRSPVPVTVVRVPAAA
jgi:nucleotide-binding universal stress UspA family protein